MKRWATKTGAEAMIKYMMGYSLTVMAIFGAYSAYNAIKAVKAVKGQFAETKSFYCEIYGEN